MTKIDVKSTDGSVNIPQTPEPNLVLSGRGKITSLLMTTAVLFALGGSVSGCNHKTDDDTTDVGLDDDSGDDDTTDGDDDSTDDDSAEGGDDSTESPNHPPEITSLEANPDPASMFDTAEVSFSADDADGDGMVYDLNLSNGNGAVLTNPSSGTCDTATHCSGTMTPGETVTVDMETAMEANAVLGLNVDDNNGGEDYTTTGVDVN